LYFGLAGLGIVQHQSVIVDDEVVGFHAPAGNVAALHDRLERLPGANLAAIEALLETAEEARQETSRRRRDLDVARAHPRLRQHFVDRGMESAIETAVVEDADQAIAREAHRLAHCAAPEDRRERLRVGKKRLFDPAGFGQHEAPPEPRHRSPSRRRS
jgi:hypothetical protein